MILLKIKTITGWQTTGFETLELAYRAQLRAIGNGAEFAEIEVI